MRRDSGLTLCRRSIDRWQTIFHELEHCRTWWNQRASTDHKEWHACMHRIISHFFFCSRFRRQKEKKRRRRIDVQEIWKVSSGKKKRRKENNVWHRSKSEIKSKRKCFVFVCSAWCHCSASSRVRRVRWYGLHSATKWMAMHSQLQSQCSSHKMKIRILYSHATHTNNACALQWSRRSRIESMRHVENIKTQLNEINSS